MMERGCKYVLISIMITILSSCASKPTDRGQQYKDGHLTAPLEWVKRPNVNTTPVNTRDYAQQLSEIKLASPALFNRNKATYQAVERWIASGGGAQRLQQFGLSVYQMEGVDDFGNVQFTGYYTPVLQVRRKRQGEFRYPLYRMPKKGKHRLPDRARIYEGALSHRNIIAYSNSLIDNFIMEVQGSGYVNYGDGSPLVFFGYGGKNGHPYRSIGKVLIDRGEVSKADMSLQAIVHWANTHSEQQVIELLEQNPSFVFFHPQPFSAVKGASAVPLIAKASLAADPSLISPGSTLLVEVPLLDAMGKFTGKYQLRLMVSLDVGGAIKGQHLDLYQGIGAEAARLAGYYNHYGRVWVLKGNDNDSSF